MSLASRYLDPVLVERLGRLEISAQRVVEGSTSGLHKSPFKGASVEFRQHRFYVPGDDPRRLDWRLLARTNRPYIKEYDEETNLRCMILVDGSGSMAYGKQDWGRKFDYAARMACSLAYLMLAHTESVGLAMFSDKLEHWIRPSSVREQMSHIITALEQATPRGTTDLAGVLHESAERLGRRSLVILVSDFFSPVAMLREGLAHFGHNRHEVIALRVLDRDEIEFPFGTWTLFQGQEQERSRLCEPAVMRNTYLENFRRHDEQLHQTCRALQCQLAQFVTDEPLADSLTKFLHHRLHAGAR